MYTILKTGGKQYRVEQGRFLDVERLPCSTGDTLHLEGWTVQSEGTVETAKITAISLVEFKGDKVLIFKKNRRHNYRRKRGHRQIWTRIRVEEIAV